MELGAIIAILAGIGLSIALFAKKPSTPTPEANPPLVVPGSVHSPLYELIVQYANLRQLDPSIVYGVIMTESSGNPDAENPSDPSTGLMGITPLIGRFYGGLEGTDAQVLLALKRPDVNVKAGTGYLFDLRKKYAANFPLQTWVQAYNVGETKFDKGIRNPSYGTSVLKFQSQWRNFS